MKFHGLFFVLLFLGAVNVFSYDIFRTFGFEYTRNNITRDTGTANFSYANNLYGMTFHTMLFWGNFGLGTVISGAIGVYENSPEAIPFDIPNASSNYIMFSCVYGPAFRIDTGDSTTLLIIPVTGFSYHALDSNAEEAGEILKYSESWMGVEVGLSLGLHIPFRDGMGFFISFTGLYELSGDPLNWKLENKNAGIEESGKYVKTNYAAIKLRPSITISY